MNDRLKHGFLSGGSATGEQAVQGWGYAAFVEVHQDRRHRATDDDDSEHLEGVHVGQVNVG